MLQPIILCLDSTTAVSSVALCQGQNILCSFTETSRTGEHSAILAPFAQQALSELKALGLTLDAIALSAGPGSYTGLRIGSALAKGLALGSNVPLIGISTLEAMAFGYIQGRDLEEDAIVMPMIDARRSEVYTAGFNHLGTRISEDKPEVLSADLFPLGVDGYHFIGNGAAKAEGLWYGDYIVDASFTPQAEQLVPLALRAFERREFVDQAYWTPNYLKDYVAVVAKNKVLGI